MLAMTAVSLEFAQLDKEISVNYFINRIIEKLKGNDERIIELEPFIKELMESDIESMSESDQDRIIEFFCLMGESQALDDFLEELDNSFSNPVN